MDTPAAHIEIWFSAGPEPLGAGYPAAGANRCNGITGYPCTGDVGGDPNQHPDWNPAAFWQHDLGVVTLEFQHVDDDLRRAADPASTQFDAHRS